MWTAKLSSIAVLAQAVGTLADTISLDWEITWVNAAPDGFHRPVIGVNGKWPCPPIHAAVGDTVVINMKNSLGNQTTGLHFHGINQLETNYMDGASMVNSCPVVPGSSMTYSFTADEPGTYWYHSHNMAQYPDGLRGPLIIHDDDDPFDGDWDNEVILTISDWYHQQTLTLVQNMLVSSNDQWRPPLPDGMIVNEGGNTDIQLDIGSTTRVRILNFGALTAFMLRFGSRDMDVIMTDGSYVQRETIHQLRIAPGQRYDVLVSATKKDQGKNIPYLISMDLNRDFTVSGTWSFNSTGYLITDSSAPCTAKEVVQQWRPFDEALFTPLDEMPLLGPLDRTWTLNFALCKDLNNIPRMCFNDQTYVMQKTPTLYTAATVGNANSDPSVYGAVLPFIIESGDVLEIVVNNLDPAIHPFHLHGHQFQVVERPESGSGSFDGSSTANPMPPRRDVISINGGSYARLRITADNPGVFLFHCHIEWHVEMGLSATLIEAPEMLDGYDIPQEMIDSCKAQGYPVAGNAAGDTANVWDDSGYNTQPPSTYSGSQWPVPKSSKSSSSNNNNNNQKSRPRRRPSGQSAPQYQQTRQVGNMSGDFQHRIHW
ncbi:hypothetical protein G7054_g13961 [Neopestalotiopsis clavispora]|nr:hypothetical protein G7054_g13961 [Neopestalotiopsis clavispora]